ncbi:MAG: hypothetical protein GWO44_17310, partial [Thermoplasmata archaeon]|nr:hypothetical protein [Thermoplasmata archaeon]NIY04960.1 hypothetical protein [Thermoplasmata archaeon]
ADRAAIRLLAKGDASAVDIYGNPAAAEEILNVRQGTVGSDVKVWAVNEA